MKKNKIEGNGSLYEVGKFVADESTFRVDAAC